MNIFIFSISKFRKIQNNTQKNVKESFRKKVTFFPKNKDFSRFTIASAALKNLKEDVKFLKNMEMFEFCVDKKLLKKFKDCADKWGGA